MLIRTLVIFIALLLAGGRAAGIGAEPGRAFLPGHVPAAVARLTATGRLAATNQLALAIGLPLRNEAQLDQLLCDVYDPASPNFHKYLTPDEFTARFGPTESDYAAIQEFAWANHLTIAGTHASRLLLDVTGPVAAVEKAFQISLRTYAHPTEGRVFFAPDTEPLMATNLRVADIQGLTDYYRFHANSHPVDKLHPPPMIANGGSASDGFSFFGNDFRNAYVPSTALTGAGQAVGLVQFDGYYSNDIAAYAAAAGGGRTNIAIVPVLLNGFDGTPGGGNAEVSLDIELAMAMAPGLSQIVVFEAPNSTAYFNDILNAMASTNQSWGLLRNLSCSWGGGGPSPTSETIFKKLAVQGQSFFNASGDSDAFTGAIPFPSESTNITQVGGAMLSMNGSGVSYASETAWNRNNGVGSSGGVSATYAIPVWQQGMNMAANGGSTTMRNIPDVALTAEYCYVYLGNGSTASYGGTSCAAPLWAGLMALVNQQAAAAGQNPPGFINPAVYATGRSTIYNSCFHDITTGNNFSTASPTNYSAVTGYDLCTGWGTPNGTNLFNALLVPPPAFLTQPASRNVTNGANVTLSATANNVAAGGYRWQFNGTNLSDGGNLSGSTTSSLAITAVTTNNSGSYQLLASNSVGIGLSGVAVLKVGYAPVVFTAPVSQTNVAGSNAVFSATLAGSPPFTFQWRKNGTNLANSGSISGATSNVLTLSGLTTNSAGNYSLVTTNIFGAATSAVAMLTVVLPPTIAGISLTNRTVECDKNTNTFAVTVTGTAPLGIQWSLDGVSVAGATNTNFALTNLSLSSHTVAVTITNLYASTASNLMVTVRDTLPPTLTLLGTNRVYLELGSGFADPGATAIDLCAGVLAVNISGGVNTNVVGTNTLTYSANDGNGNTSAITRSVIVRDTTPPTIQWSFTNLVLAADTNCSALMPNVTGTNFILATDLSGALIVSQSPTNQANLLLGTNVIIITVADASGNAAYSTNEILVQDQTPPVITLSGGDPFYVELGSVFVDPGAVAVDTCAGNEVVTVSGEVNLAAIGINTLTYSANDGNGNTSTITRSVIVRDTTPPTIQWSFTNLVLAADTNCSALMPDVTSANFILATDLSGVVAISQSPTNTAILSFGTNVVVITVADAFGNAAYSTNEILVQDQTPPLWVSSPPSQTNWVGANVSFSAVAMACTPVSWQWFLNHAPLVAATNSLLSLTNLTLAMTGDYYVVATGAGGCSTSAVATLSVALLPSAMTLTASANPAGFRASLNFTASITPTNATGTLEFSTNGEVFDWQPLVAGQAVSTNLATLPRGTNVVLAVYSGDGTYLPATNSLAQMITNHPPEVQPLMLTNSAAFSLTIALADLTTNWSDGDGDLVTLVAVSVSQDGITLTNTGAELVYFNPNPVPDQFTCTVTDGWGGTNFQTVTIIPAPTNPVPLITSLLAASSGLTLNLSGAPGSTYILEATTNLARSGGWGAIATNTLGTNGLWQFTDLAITNSCQQFYRLKLSQ